jgi:hypothetical protein
MLEKQKSAAIIPEIAGSHCLMPSFNDGIAREKPVIPFF